MSCRIFVGSCAWFKWLSAEPGRVAGTWKAGAVLAGGPMVRGGRDNFSRCISAEGGKRRGGPDDLFSSSCSPYAVVCTPIICSHAASGLVDPCEGGTLHFLLLRRGRRESLHAWDHRQLDHHLLGQLNCTWMGKDGLIRSALHAINDSSREGCFSPTSWIICPAFGSKMKQARKRGRCVVLKLVIENPGSCPGLETLP